MKLNERESRVLACCELKADMSIDELRKETGYRDHTIRYCLRRLRERGVIREVPFINLPALGYTMHNVFFSLGSQNKNLKQAFLKELHAHPQIIWVAEMGAEFQYGIEIAAKHLGEVRTILHSLAEKFGNVFYQKAVSSQFGAHLLPRGYLWRTRTPGSGLSLDRSAASVNIDGLDDKILSALALNAELSHRQIAQKIRMPLSTFELRVKKLRQSGILLGYFEALNPLAFGAQNFKILVFGKGTEPKLMQRLKSFSIKHPNIVSLYECFGSWDFELGVEVFEPQDVVTITQELYEEIGAQISSLKVLSKFRDLKVRLYPAS